MIETTRRGLGMFQRGNYRPTNACNTGSRPSQPPDRALDSSRSKIRENKGSRSGLAAELKCGTPPCG